MKVCYLIYLAHIVVRMKVEIYLVVRNVRSCICIFSIFIIITSHLLHYSLPLYYLNLFQELFPFSFQSLPLASLFSLCLPTPFNLTVLFLIIALSSLSPLFLSDRQFHNTYGKVVQI